MTVYVECEDPRVLAERLRCEGRGSVHVRVASGWVDLMAGDAPAIARMIREEHARYRLVFPDAEAAGKGLVDYRDRLGARVRWRKSSGGDEAADFQHLPSLIQDDDHGYFVAAPTEEPRPEPARCSADGGPPCSSCESQARPALPEGVEPVAWSDRKGCWVLRRCDVPTGWEITYTDSDGWIDVRLGNRWDDDTRIVLARPVPPPEPETEKVWWHDALTEDRKVNWCGDEVSDPVVAGHGLARVGQASQFGDRRYECRCGDVGSWLDSRRQAADEHVAEGPHALADRCTGAKA